MTIIAIEIWADLASTFLASYGTLDKSFLKDTLMDPQTGADFTSTQADAFIERYELKHQLPNQSSGFSATVFWDKIEQKHVLAIRGTEINWQGIPSDLFSADLGGIGATGFANQQAADLYRYWKRLTTPAGQSVHYSMDELVKLYMLENANTMTVAGIVGSAAFILFQDTFNADTGLGLIGVN